MNKNKRKGLFRALAACTLSVALLAASSCSSPFGGGPKGRPRMKIAVITKQQLSFWDDVKKGAEDAGNDMGYDIIYSVAQGDNDYVTQIDAIHEAMKQGARAIVIAPNSVTDLNATFKEAEAQNIKIININSKADYEGVSTLVYSSDTDSGAVAARNAVKILKASDPELKNLDKIGIIGHTAPTAEERINSFIGVFTSSASKLMQPGNISLTEEEELAGMSIEEKTEQERAAMIDKLKKGFQLGTRCAKREDAKSEALKLLGKEGNGISVMFATNTNTTLGVCDAVNELGLGEKIIVIGFNSDEEELSYIRTGVLDGTVVQNPYVMGYLGIRYAHKLIDGGDVPLKLDTGATFVTQSNMTNDFVQLMLYPDKQ